MRFKLKALPLAMAAALAISISGCDQVPESETSSAKLSGVASKGIIKNGVVSAYPVINGIIQPIAIATTTTDDEGKYSLSIPGYNGPLSILVSKADDGSSQVVCDVSPTCKVGDGTVNFGADMPLNFTMESIVPKAQAGSEVQVAITPFTTMAAKYAKKLGVTEESATLANKKVGNMLGVVNLIGTQPVDITSSTKIAAELNPEAIKYAILSAAIAKVANDDASGDIGSVISSFATAYAEKDGQLLGNESTDDAAIFSLEDITNAANDVVTGVETEITSVNLGTTTKDELTSLNTDTGNLTADAETAITVTPIASTDVDKAKEIVEEMRTWATSIKELGSDAELFGTEVDMAMQSGGDALEAPLQAMGYSVEAMVLAYAQSKDTGETTFALSDLLSLANGDSDYFEAQYDSNGVLGDPRAANTLSGNVIVIGSTVSITGGTVDGSSVTLSLDLPVSLSGSSFTAGFTPLTAGYTISSTGADLHISSGTVSVSLDQTVDLMSDVQPAVEPNPTFASASLVAELTQKLSNTVTYPVKFAGSIEATVNFTQDDLGTNFNPSHIALDGSFSNMETDGTTVRNIVTAKFDANMSNAATFKRPTQPLVGSTQTVGSYSFSSDGSFTLVMTNQTVVVSLSAGTINIVTTYEDGYSWENNYSGVTETSVVDWLNADNFYKLNATYVYVESVGDVMVTEPVMWTVANGTLSGTLTWAEEIDEDATNYRKIDGTLTLTTDFKNVPDVEVVVTAKRTAQEAGTGSATFKYDGFLVEFKANIDGVNKNNNQVSASILNLTSNNKLVIYPDLEHDGFYGTLSVNNNVVGSITNGLSAAGADALIINYVNGEFESVTF